MLKKNTMCLIKTYLSENTETLNYKERLGREELIVVHNWMKSITNKHKDVTKNIYFIYARSY